jgi:hypothetical protein
MSNKALDYVFTHSKTKGSARVLMLAIADMANDDGECWPGKARLEKKVNVTLRNVIKLIQECERLGELAVTERPDTTNRYAIIGMAKSESVKKARAPRAKWVAPVKEDTSVTGDTSVENDTTTSVTHDSTPVVSPVTPKPLVSNPQDKPKIVAAAPPTLALEPKAEKKTALRSEGKPYPVYDALESRGWGIPFKDTAPRMWTQPIGVIAKWLTCEVWTFQKQPLGKNETPATAEDVFAFYDWWARNNPKATPPRNVFKFIDHWREWKAAQAKSTSSGLHIFKSAEAS